MNDIKLDGIVNQDLQKTAHLFLQFGTKWHLEGNMKSLYKYKVDHTKGRQNI